MSGYEPCGLGVCAADAGHEEPCAVASGWADEEELWAEVARLRDQRDALAARLAAVEALARKWALEWKENPAPTNAEAARYGAAKVLRAALATGTATNQEEDQQ